MFRKMRRFTQQMSEEEVQHVLNNSNYGILSVIGDDGYPYGVPVNYHYYNGKIYFHCAKQGHKLDAINKENKVCFTIVSKDDVVAQKLTTAYESIIIFGTARIIIDREEKWNVHIAFSNKFSSQYPDEIMKEAKVALDHMEMVEITIDYMTGKQGKEVIAAKEKQQ